MAAVIAVVGRALMVPAFVTAFHRGNDVASALFFWHALRALVALTVLLLLWAAVAKIFAKPAPAEIWRFSGYLVFIAALSYLCKGIVVSLNGGSHYFFSQQLWFILPSLANVVPMPNSLVRLAAQFTPFAVFIAWYSYSWNQKRCGRYSALLIASVNLCLFAIVEWILAP